MRAMIAMNGWEDVHTRGQTVTSAVSIGAGARISRPWPWLCEGAEADYRFWNQRYGM